MHWIKSYSIFTARQTHILHPYIHRWDFLYLSLHYVPSFAKDNRNIFTFCFRSVDHLGQREQKTHLHQPRGRRNRQEVSLRILIFCNSIIRDVQKVFLNRRISIKRTWVFSNRATCLLNWQSSKWQMINTLHNNLITRNHSTKWLTIKLFNNSLGWNIA